MSLKEEFEQLKLQRANPEPIVEQADHDPEDENVEYEEVKGFNVLILTSSTDSKNRKLSKKQPTVQRIEGYCQKNDIKCYTAFADTAFLDKTDKGKIIISNVGDKKGFVIDRDKTLVIARRGVLFHRYSLNLMSRLERYRFCFLNERVAIENCEDKYLTTLKLVESGLPVPKTALVPTEEMINIAFEKVGGKFPVVLKTLNGTQGVGVFILNDHRALKSTLQTIWSVGNTVEIMMQEYIESEYDIRVHVLGDEVLACIRRDVVEGDFRSNVHLGGKPSSYECSPEVADIAIKAAKSLKCKWAGVDIMFDADKNPYILEVNASAGTEGVISVSNVDIIDSVMTYCKNGINWNRPPQEVGVLETINIDGLGELPARFDTGNSSKSVSLDAQDIKVEGRRVTWVTNGVRLSGTKYGGIRMKSNGDSESKEDMRPMVKLDVTFDGVTYKDVLFNLNDRSHKTTPVLINKDFMIRSGSVINPSRIYMVTNKVKPKEIENKEEEREEN